MSRHLALLAHAGLALYLAGLLAVPRAPSTLAGVTVLCALAAMLTALVVDRAGRRAERQPGSLAAADPLTDPAFAAPAALALFALPALGWGLIVAVQIVSGVTPAKFGNQVLATLLSTAILLSRVPLAIPDVRRLLLPSAAIGAIGAGALALWQSEVLHIARPHGWLGASEIGTGAIKFGDLSTVLALLSLVLALGSRGWRQGLGLLGLACGMLALSLSQARGGLLGALLAIGALALAVLLGGGRRAGATSTGRWNRRRLMIGAVGLAFALATVASMLDRFAAIEPQLQRYQQGDAHSETGQRLVLWQAAVRAGLAAPWTGVGLAGFGAELDRQRADGRIPSSMQVLYRQPHNEYLNAFATAGVPGLVAISALFWLPILLLIRRIAAGHDTPQARAALVTIAAFAGFALTDSMFDRQITVFAFFLLGGWLLRMAFPGPGAASAPAGIGPGPQPRPALSSAVPSSVPSAASSDGYRPAAAGATQPRLSVAIITKNEGHRIVRCLESVAFADQIVVVDSGSEDDTVALARRFGAEVVITRDWPGFGMQKNRALDRCAAPWVLSIDADEVVDDALRTAIEAVVAADAAGASADSPNGYWMVRRSRFCGQTIRFGNWRNDRVLRLFRREGSRFSDDLVHERVLCAEPFGILAGVLDHDSIDSIEDAREKTWRYARAGAIQLRQRGRGGLFSACTHAGWSFIRGYLLRLGFLDGRHGFTLAWLAAQGTWWRYRWAKMPQMLADDARADAAPSPDRRAGPSDLD